MTAPESRDAQSGLAEVLAEVSAVHDGCEITFSNDGAVTCDGSLIPFGTYVSITHAQRLHVAAMQAAALGPVIVAARAEALREAAEQCDRDAEDGHCGSPVCAENNRITARWLRDRADREQAGHQDAQDGPGAASRGEVAPGATGALNGAQRLTGNDDDTEDR